MTATHRTDAVPGSRSGRRERRSTARTALVLGAVIAVVAVLTAAFQLGLPWWMQDGDRNHVYRGEEGALRYQVHLPPQHDGTSRLPVVVAVHGCGMTGYGWNSMKATTQLNALADREGFVVVYPTQRLFRHALNCWNPADPRHQLRDRGEPALLAGVARQAVQRYGADPAQVHVTGASSGAGVAVVLAATYPDVFATASSVAGGEYGLDRVDPDDPDATPPEHTARQAWAQMGDRARLVPLLVVQGQEDDVVVPLVGRRLVEQWTAVADLVDDGSVDDSLDLAESTRSVPGGSGRHPYSRTVLATGDGTTVVESYLVAGMGHAWPGPSGDGTYTDRRGPDASALVWDFARRHPMP